MKFHKDNTLPQNGEVFVFGSNLAGIHGAGAAKQAYLKFGARMGHGIGLTGSSYAIPTKDQDLNTMKLESIKPYIERFKKFTLEHPNVEFFITRVGCGLAGYKDKEMAPLFRGCGSNCSFPEQWEYFLKD